MSPAKANGFNLVAVGKESYRVESRMRKSSRLGSSNYDEQRHTLRKQAWERATEFLQKIETTPVRTAGAAQHYPAILDE